MNKPIILDAGPLGRIAHPRPKREIALWLEQMLAAEAGESFSLDGEVLQPNEIQILRQARDGAPEVRSDRFISIELPCELNDELIAEGIAREVIHHIQQMRKDAGYKVEDRIAVTFVADPQPTAAMSLHTTYIQQETLARTLQEGNPQGDRVETFEIDGKQLTLGIRREGS